MTDMASYDFVIVGGGTSGSVLASRLARSASRPSVLLLEAGGSSIAAEDLDVSQRFHLAFKPDSPLNWNHKTTEQFGRPIDYSAGRVLGGSTAINFSAFTLGSQEDYNEWARIADDEAFSWPQIKQVLSRIERYHKDLHPSNADYVRLPERDVGHGSLDLTYGEGTSPTIHQNFTAADQVGWPRNLNLNSGNPIGFGISPACFLNGKRVTAASAYLDNPPDNLTIITNTTIARISTEDLQVIDLDGHIYQAQKEIIICCGAVKTPQLLMLSGIGDPEELLQHGIHPKHPLPRVGKGLQDHCFTTAGILLHTDTPTPPVPPTHRIPSMKGWFKLPDLPSTPEFKSLSPSTQSHLQHPSVPHWEIAITAPPTPNDDEKAAPFPPNQIPLTAIALLMNPQSRGTISLQSSSPTLPPLINPSYLTHPLDLKTLLLATRSLLTYLTAPTFASNTLHPLSWPNNDSDESLTQYIKENLASSWHPCGTVSMGRNSNEACVDGDFKVFGVRGVRVVDLSVVPVLPSAHTMSVGFLVGEIAGGKILGEWGFDNR